MADLRRAIRRRRAAELTVDPLIDTVQEFGGAVADAVGKRYNLANPRAEKFLRAYMAERVGMVNATTRKAVHKALKADDPTTAVREVFRHAKESRARQIAVSEVTRTSNWAAIDAGKWVKVLDLKTWASLMDGHERHTHHEMHGQVVGWNEDFVSPSGAKGPFPGALGRPEEDINERCSAVPTRRGVKLRFDQDPVVLYDALREPMIRDMERAWQAAFDEQEAAVLAEIE